MEPASVGPSGASVQGYDMWDWRACMVGDVQTADTVLADVHQHLSQETTQHKLISIRVCQQGCPTCGG